MQSSDQQSSEQSKRQSEEVPEVVEPAAGPFYEFSAAGAWPQNAPAPVEVQPPAQSSPGEPAYPPPPSFYQNLPAPSEKQPLSPPAVVDRPSVTPTPSVGGVRPTYQPGPGYPPPPGPRAKRSHKGLWITLSIVGVLLLLICGLCGWAGYTLFVPSFQNASGIVTEVNSYYQSVEQRNYTSAYADLHVDGLTPDAFAQQAQLRDTQAGTITSFMLGTPVPDTSHGSGGIDFSYYTADVTVVRVNASYTVHLDLQKINGSWKITYFDKI